MVNMTIFIVEWNNRYHGHSSTLRFIAHCLKVSAIQMDLRFVESLNIVCPPCKKKNVGYLKAAVFVS